MVKPQKDACPKKELFFYDSLPVILAPLILHFFASILRTERQSSMHMPGTSFLATADKSMISDKQTDDGFQCTWCPGANYKCQEIHNHVKGLKQTSPSALISPFFFLFSLPFFFLYAPGVNKRGDPVARKTTLYMKPFTPSQDPGLVHEKFSVKTLYSPINIEYAFYYIYI